MNYLYRAYGLTLSSDTPVPALRREHTHFKTPDVAMSFGSEPNWVKEALQLRPQVARPRAGEPQGDDSPFTLTSFGEEDFFELAYGDGARFFVDSEAKLLWGTCLAPLTLEDLGTYLLGPVLGFVLRRRGAIALHASSVCLSGQAVVLCGPSESGKSTTAAALALRGIPVIAEDISPLSERDRWLCVEPGYPRICLWPDSVKSLFGAENALPPLTPTWEKCFLPLDGVSARFEFAKQPLGAVYLFGPRVYETSAPRIEDLGVRDALLELVQNTYMNWLLDRTQRGAELDVLSKLVTDVPVRRIIPHSNPARLGALCDLVLKDAQRQLGQQALAAGSGR